MSDIAWMDQPEDHDFTAASNYLSLLGIKSFEQHGTGKFRARDILRAAGLPKLPQNDPHVQKDIAKIKDGQKLSPVLLMPDIPLIIADGYHRVCAVDYVDQDAFIPATLLK